MSPRSAARRWRSTADTRCTRFGERVARRFRFRSKPAMTRAGIVGHRSAPDPHREAHSRFLSQQTAHRTQDRHHESGNRHPQRRAPVADLRTDLRSSLIRAGPTAPGMRVRRPANTPASCDCAVRRNVCCAACRVPMTVRSSCGVGCNHDPRKYRSATALMAAAHTSQHRAVPERKFVPIAIDAVIVRRGSGTPGRVV